MLIRYRLKQNQQQKMSILNNLMEFSSSSSSLLGFMQTPTTSNQAAPTRDERSRSSVATFKGFSKKQEKQEKRAVSTNKISFFQHFDKEKTKINPKERLLHRLVQKMENKLRKIKYGFFVTLETIKKKDIWMHKKEVHLPPNFNAVKVKNFMGKIQQIQQLLFAKYYGPIFKTFCFQQIKAGNAMRVSMRIINSIFKKKQMESAFKKVIGFMRWKEREEIRIDIMVDNVQNVIFRVQAYFSKELSRKAFQNIIQKGELQRKKEAKRYEIVDQEILSMCKLQKQPKEVKKAKEVSPKKNSTDSIKAASQIEVSYGQKQLKIYKTKLITKSYVPTSRISQAHYEALYEENQKMPHVCHKLDSERLNIQQIEDIYDKNCLFFCEELQPKRIDLEVSKVENFRESNFNSNYQDSRLTIINGLGELPSRKKDRKGAFGTEAVSFKNSLISERESFNSSNVGDFMQKDIKTNFMKNKKRQNIKTGSFAPNEQSLQTIFYKAEKPEKCQPRRETSELFNRNKYNSFAGTVQQKNNVKIGIEVRQKIDAMKNIKIKMRPETDRQRIRIGKKTSRQESSD